ncbi:sure-like protein [Gymnopus androsaceus JB14]|uniref:Sure-like protein n=1 Tax=Gymnopus androsaceus JB14 TaxID=1447944 RepID=A0A6A4HSY5_9AGAR|nr:sure-like protein [Gymnopus androsaceus JB14]
MCRRPEGARTFHSISEFFYRPVTPPQRLANNLCIHKAPRAPRVSKDYPSLVPMNLLTSVAALLLSISLVQSTNLILTNDDGWAVAMIRQQYAALIDAGYDVVLASPAENESGTSSMSATPTVLNITCEFDTCPIGSPPEGFNASEPTLNYINSFPVNAVAFGIQTLAPQFFGGPPDFVVSGPNVGNNLGQATVNISGTVHFRAVVSSGIVVKYVDALLAGGFPVLPAGISVNVNWPAATPSTCPDAEAYSFIPTVITANPDVADAEICGTDQLPAETDVVAAEGCFVSVSVMNATSKTDVDAATQAAVFQRLDSILSCPQTVPL